MRINNSQFSSIIKSARNCNTLVFKFCEFSIYEDLDFNIDEEYKIEVIDFNSSGSNFYSNWKYNSESFKRIIKAMKDSKLDKSLKFIQLYNCGSSIEEFRSILTDNDMNHVQVNEDETEISENGSILTES